MQMYCTAALWFWGLITFGCIQYNGQVHQIKGKKKKTNNMESSVSRWPRQENTALNFLCINRTIRHMISQMQSIRQYFFPFASKTRYYLHYTNQMPTLSFLHSDNLVRLLHCSFTAPIWMMMKWILLLFFVVVEPMESVHSMYVRMYVCMYELYVWSSLTSCCLFLPLPHFLSLSLSLLFLCTIRLILRK